MQFIGLLAIAIFGIWLWDHFPWVIILIGAAIMYFIAAQIVDARKERARIAKMSPEAREQYEKEILRQAQINVFGPINEHLVCPHCQNKGSVHAKKEMRVTTSVGKVGGILKTNTSSQVTRFVTQHHCKICSTTWDI